MRGVQLPSPHNRNEEGFSLVEVLVALALVSLMTAMAAGFFGQLRAFSDAGRRAEVQAELDAAARYLAQSIEGAQPLPLLWRPPEQRAQLSGQADQLDFVLVAPVGANLHALRQTRFHIAGEGRDRRLAQTLWPRRPMAEPDTLRPLEIGIVRGDLSLGLRYIGEREDHSGWTEAWSEPTTLPRGVEVTLRLRRDGTDYVAQDIALPRITRLREAATSRTASVR